jgi:hypothetical protein
VVERLPCKHEALSSNSITTKRNNKIALFFLGTGDGTQGLTHAKQAVYHLNSLVCVLFLKYILANFAQAGSEL